MKSPAPFAAGDFAYMLNNQDDMRYAQNISDTGIKAKKMRLRRSRGDASY